MGKYDARFQLKTPKSKDKSVIRLRMSFDYIDFTWELNDSLNRKLKIYPELWDTDNQYPIPKSKIPKKFQEETYNLQIIQERIDKVKVIISQIINEAALNEIKITNNYLKHELLIRLGLAQKPKEITVYNFCYQVIEDMAKGTLLIEKTNKRYETDTIKQYKVLATLFEAKYPNLLFSEIDKIWYNNFKLFLLDNQEFNYKSKDGEDKLFSKQALRNGAIGNYIKNLKTVMKIAYNRGISNNLEYKADWFIKPPATPSGKTDIFLTEKEIKKIYEFTPYENVKDKSGKLIGRKTLEKAKDLFLLGCYTGLRVSDYNNILNRTNFMVSEKGTNILAKSTQKTGEKVYIPIFWNELIQIAEKYNYEFPKMSDQKINDYIKLVCREVEGFNTTSTFYDIIGGVKQLIKHEKWELITTHTGRRSASTNLSLRGLSETEIAKFTGHKSNSMVARYNKTSNMQTADMLMEKLKGSK